MAMNWILALKAVPWTDLVQAAPSLLKGARKLFVRDRMADAEASASSARAPQSSVDARLTAIESALATLSSEQRASAEMIRSLAEQNARVVEAMAIMRARARLLLGLCIALVVALGALSAWMVAR